MIRFYHVTKRYRGGKVGLLDVTFHLPRGSFLFVTGASGAGKSTLLKLIFRDLLPTSGYIVVNGRNVTSIPHTKVPYLRRTIGVVFQDFRLIPRRTVLENLELLPRLLGVEKKIRKRTAYKTLRRMGLAHRMRAYPAELSGGEQQRVAIARALMNDPEILIADEPTGNLDPELSQEIFRIFLEINNRGTTVLVATHDASLIEEVGGEVLVLDKGKIIESRPVNGRRHWVDRRGAQVLDRASFEVTGHRG